MAPAVRASQDCTRRVTLPPGHQSLLIFNLPTAGYEVSQIRAARARATGMTQTAEALLDELDHTLKHVSGSRRLAMLRQMTDLFLVGATTYSDEVASLFDVIIKRLSEGVELRQLIELSQRLADADTVASDTVVRLSNSDDVAVAGPVLERSPALSDVDLVRIAKTKGQGHLLAIATRQRVNDVVSDVLIERGNKNVLRKVTGNNGAKISEDSFARLISEAKGDKTLAELVKTRPDIPEELRPFVSVMLTGK